MRTIVKPRRLIKEIGNFRTGIYPGKLGEDYDGIGQYVLVSLSSASIGGAYKARVASGDFGNGRFFPVGTPVSIASYHGKLEVLSLGAGPCQCGGGG